MDMKTAGLNIQGGATLKMCWSLMDMKKAGLNTLLSAICFELCRESIIRTARLLWCRRQQGLNYLPV